MEGVSLFFSKNHYVRNISAYSKLEQNSTAQSFNSFQGQSKEIDLEKKQKLNELKRSSQSTVVKSSSQNILESTKKAAEGIRSGRSKAKDTKLQVNKLKYSFKSISSKLLRCKKSSSAKQIISEARREVQRLKRQRQSGDCDEEEIQNAITHAEKMVRVAKKKARHLEEEEMVKSSGGIFLDKLQENEESDVEETGEDNLSEEELQSLDEAEYEDIDYEDIEYEEMMSDITMEDLMSENQKMMEYLMEDMWEDMKELMEDMGLEDLLGDMSVAQGEKMDPEDIKLMKIKHRNSEMKDIVKADAEYLKAVFDKLSSSGPQIDIAVSGAALEGSVGENTPSIDIAL